MWPTRAIFCRWKSPATLRIERASFWGLSNQYNFECTIARPARSHSERTEYCARFARVYPRMFVENQWRFDSYFDSAADTGLNQDHRRWHRNPWMNETDTLGLKLLRAHRRNQLGASACGEDKRNARAAACVAARGRDEIHEHGNGSAFAAGQAAAAVGILAAGGGCAIGRIGDDQVETCRLDSRDCSLPKVGANRIHRFEAVDGGATGNHGRQRRLDLDRDDFARPIKRGHHDRYDAASSAQLEHSLASTRAREAAEQNRLDREAVTMPGLDQRDTPVQDRVVSFVFVA